MKTAFSKQPKDYDRGIPAANFGRHHVLQTHQTCHDFVFHCIVSEGPHPGATNGRARNVEPSPLPTSEDHSLRGSLLQSSHINHKAIFHVALDEPVVGLVDLLNGDQLDVRGDSVLSAEVQHLLGFADAADCGTGQAASLHNQTEAIDWRWLWRRADQGHGAVELQ